jgi:hypothetical protein
MPLIVVLGKFDRVDEKKTRPTADLRYVRGSERGLEIALRSAFIRANPR